MPQIVDLGKLRFYWAGEYDPATTYEINDVVKYGGNIYVYTNSVSNLNVLPTTTTHWALMVQGMRFQGAYAATTQYRIGDGVAYGGTVYLALQDVMGVTPGSDATIWTRFLEGIQFEGAYLAATAYQKSDIVTYGPDAYIAKADTQGNVPTNTTFWAKLISGISPEGVWSSTKAYLPNQVVAYGARLYRALLAHTNSTPAPTGNANWELFVDSIAPRGEWVENRAYFPNDVVTFGGSTYVCGIAHTSGLFSLPTSVVSPGPQVWTKFNSGIRWRGTRAPSTRYLTDDIVTDGISTYIVVTDNFTPATLGPARDDTNLQLLAKGADPLPAQAGNAGKYLSTDGTNARWSPAADPWVIVTGNTTAVHGSALFVSTNTAAVTVTLPNTPNVNDQVKIVDLAGTFGVRNCTVSPGANARINGGVLADTLVLNVPNTSVTLVYSGSLYGWKVV